MKLRIEPQGLHYYCRRSGTHVLLDEVKTLPESYSIAPRTVSIAITDECDFNCSYCYVNLKDRYLKKESILLYCKKLDKFGTFDVAFGGGEPTLHPDLIEICEKIWKETELGISITTHGHNLNEEYLLRLKDKISFLRISIDGIEPIYSQLRKKPLKDLLPNLLHIKNNKIPFGINSVINKLNIGHLDDLKFLFQEYGAFELLLLPMWQKGKYVLTDNEWSILNEWIERNYKDIPIRISMGATKYLNLPYLFNNEDVNDYAFIGIDDTLRKDSFTNGGLVINDFNNFEQLLIEWRNTILN